MMDNKTMNAMQQRQGLIIAIISGVSNDPKDEQHINDNDPTTQESNQKEHEKRREDIGPDNNEWQKDQRKEDPNRDDGLRDKPKVDRINRPRDNI